VTNGRPAKEKANFRAFPGTLLPSLRGRPSAGAACRVAKKFQAASCPLPTLPDQVGPESLAILGAANCGATFDRDLDGSDFGNDLGELVPSANRARAIRENGVLRRNADRAAALLAGRAIPISGERRRPTTFSYGLGTGKNG